MIRWKVWWSLLIPPFRMKTDGQIYFRPEALKKIKSLLCEIFEVCELVSQQHVWRHVSVKKWYRNDQLLSRYFDILRYLRWKLLQILETGPALISLDLWICFLMSIVDVTMCRWLMHISGRGEVRPEYMCLTYISAIHPVSYMKSPSLYFHMHIGNKTRDDGHAIFNTNCNM